LELAECLQLTSIGLFEISICKCLRTLDLNSHHISRPLVTSAAISHLSKSCQHLQTVLLSRCISIDDECVEELAKNCRFLANLNLGGCPLIGDKSLMALGKYCHNLRSIYVSRTNISDEGVFGLMTTNVAEGIEEIHMAHCDHVTDEAIECILLKSKSVKYLMFHCCKRTTGMV
jgi:EIN3-binding F-box protein